MEMEIWLRSMGLRKIIFWQVNILIYWQVIKSSGWISTQIIGTSYQTAVFIGLQQIPNNSTQYYWTDNSPLGYTNWCTNDPTMCPNIPSNGQTSLLAQIQDSQHNAVCLNLAASNGKVEQNSWMECQKLMEINAVCQTETVLEAPPVNCPMGWTYFERTQKCYKVGHGPFLWIRKVLDGL